MIFSPLKNENEEYDDDLFEENGNDWEFII
jgi:hypothetical protein